jgi:LacI family transcriptional regulator
MRTDRLQPVPPSVRPSSDRRAAAALASQLRQQILAGRIPAGDVLPSVRALGREQRLACSTVHRALRQLVKEGLAAAEPRSGYRVLAKGHGIERGCPLGVVLEARASETLWHQRLMAQAQQSVNRRGLSMLVVTKSAEAPAAETLQKLLAARVWGVLLYFRDAELLGLLQKAGIPVVLTCAPVPGVYADTVTQDCFDGGMLAASHLLQRGHRRLAWIEGSLANAPIETIERYAGVVGQLTRASRTLDHVLQLPSQPSSTAQKALVRLLAPKSRPTGILALQQGYVRLVVGAARELRLVPGRDFEMVGWWTDEAYDSEYAPLFRGGPIPPAVLWSVDAMTEIALSRLIERRAQPELPTICLRIPPRLRM